MKPGDYKFTRRTMENIIGPLQKLEVRVEECKSQSKDWCNKFTLRRKIKNTSDRTFDVQILDEIRTEWVGRKNDVIVFRRIYVPAIGGEIWVRGYVREFTDNKCGSARRHSIPVALERSVTLFPGQEETDWAMGGLISRGSATK